MSKEYIFENNLVNIGLMCGRIIKSWKLILLSGLIFLSLAFVFVKLYLKPIWMSSAIVSSPAYSQLSEIRTEVSPLTNIDPSTKILVSNYTSSKWLIEQFVQEYDKYDTKLEFIKNNKKLFGITDGPSENLQIKNALNKIDLQKNKNGKNTFELTASSYSPEVSYNILSDYINLVNSNVISKMAKNLNALVRNEKDILINKSENAYNRAYIILDELKERNNFALRLAKSAKVEYPKENLDEDDKKFAFAIGSRALEEKAKILNTTKSLNVFNSEISILKYNLKMVNDIKIRDKLDINVYDLVKSPSEPLTPEKNKALVIIILGAIFGLILGMVIAVFKNK
ncbi:Wzz/FepE/Etk N-terminal domain-containing protein [Photobacterium leiognathi]|uniref:Wzz/FepE/Etk N-terminal domain-containing protein n=1 Tax=Photobacterium leiognathi TaxID=553611 RepID=UPI002982A6FB|nr:Wzz/FepE/Etk N-terminal domain-containing protein [Photobacterium leiognathi]